MAILKNKTQGRYTIVSQVITMDSDLSLVERGLLLSLLSYPDDFNFSIAWLSKRLPDGKEKIAKTLNSLIEKGYVTRIQIRNADGKFDSNNLEVHETPFSVSNNTSSDVTAHISPCPEKPDTVSSPSEKPQSDIPSQYITNNSNTNTLNTLKVCKGDTLNDNEYADLVSEFGKENVDYQINRIKGHSYKGCLNYNTIKKWCDERKTRVISFPNHKPKINSFCDFRQSEIDFEDLEKRLVKN